MIPPEGSPPDRRLDCKFCGEIFKSQNIEMSIDRFVAGYDKNGKHMDTKATLSWDNSKITIHAYNSPIEHLFPYS